MLRRTFLGLVTTMMALGLIAPGAAQAAHGEPKAIKIGKLVLHQPWSRASLTSTAKSGAAYLVIENKGDADDILQGAKTNAAKMTEIHKTEMQDGTMKMMPAGPVTIPAGSKVELAPGGFHIMLMGLKAPLKEGETLEITLDFKRAGMHTIEFPILSGTAKGSMHDH